MIVYFQVMSVISENNKKLTIFEMEADEADDDPENYSHEMMN